MVPAPLKLRLLEQLSQHRLRQRPATDAGTFRGCARDRRQATTAEFRRESSGHLRFVRALQPGVHVHHTLRAYSAQRRSPWRRRNQRYPPPRLSRHKLQVQDTSPCYLRLRARVAIRWLLRSLPRAARWQLPDTCAGAPVPRGTARFLANPARSQSARVRQARRDIPGKVPAAAARVQEALYQEWSESVPLRTARYSAP